MSDPISGATCKRIPYPTTDPTNGLADEVERRTTNDGMKVTKDTWADWKKKEQAPLETLKTAASVVWTGVGIAKEAKDGNFRGAFEKFRELEEKTIGGAKTSGDAKAQVFHNERATITAYKYMLDRGLISQRQFDAVVSDSPQAKQFAYGTSSLDERVALYKQLAKETGADKKIEAEVVAGKTAALKFEIRGPADLARAQTASADFAKAYREMPAFRAGVDAMIDNWKNDRARYDADVQKLTPPTPQPLAC
jgi:hypothetical protein